jgi:hypothetical protein
MAPRIIAHSALAHFGYYRSVLIAQLANTLGTRAFLVVAAFQWRKLAEKAAGTAKDPLAIAAGSDASELARKPKLAKALKRTKILFF